MVIGGILKLLNWTQRSRALCLEVAFFSRLWILHTYWIIYSSEAGTSTVYNWKALRTAITLSWDSSGVKDHHNSSLSETEFLQLHINRRHFSEREKALSETTEGISFKTFNLHWASKETADVDGSDHNDRK